MKNFKLTTIIISGLMWNYCIGQSLNIHCETTQPRSGQSISVFMSLNPTFEFDSTLKMEDITEALSQTIPVEHEISSISNSIDSRRLTMQLKFSDIGDFKIGPINLISNNNIIESNEVNINVLPELPNEEGVWLRNYEENGKIYLVLEQNTFIEKAKRNERGALTSCKDRVQIDTESFKNLTINKTGSRSSIHYDRNSDSEYCVKSTSFTYEIGNVLEKSITITKDNLLNLGENIDFKTYTIVD